MSDPTTPREIIASLRQQITAMKKEWEEERREIAELNATLDTIIAADDRAVKLWRAAHPGNELVIPDRAKLVAWLLEQNAELRAHAERVGQANDRLVVENDALREALAIESERSLYWRNIAGRKEEHP